MTIHPHHHMTTYARSIVMSETARRHELKLADAHLAESVHQLELAMKRFTLAREKEKCATLLACLHQLLGVRKS